jgi:outer membrane receptor protein involved in Fe transport
MTDRVLSTRISYLYHDEETNRLNAGPDNTVPGYSLLNINVDLELGKGFTAFAYGRNITDEVYFLELNGGARLVGAPATYGVGLRANF